MTVSVYDMVHHVLYLPVDLVIGFLQEDYTVTESVGVVTVVFGVIGPPLITVDVLAIVELQLIAGTATRKYK